jgi:large subunit ribosomal protein L5
MAARLKEQYLNNIVPALTKEFSYSNRMAVPKVEKVSLNVGMGEATQNSKLIDGAVNELTAIAGQKPVITKARKSIAAFKLRENMPIGCTVTLRGDRRACATSAAFPRSRSMAAAITRWASRIS